MARITADGEILCGIQLPIQTLNERIRQPFWIGGSIRSRDAPEHIDQIARFGAEVLPLLEG